MQPIGTKPEWIIIDAGLEHIRILSHEVNGKAIDRRIDIPSSSDLQRAFTELGLLGVNCKAHAETLIFITGKLAEVVHQILGRGTIILPAAALWAAAAGRVKQTSENDDSIAIIDLSASGYLLIGVDALGNLKQDLLVVNPRCGAGSGTNIDRVLQKLAIKRSDVDRLLEKYLGDAGTKQRVALTVRADRCGVFASSATISDKNQGIPLDHALAVTLKSEILKTCQKLPIGFKRVQLTGGVFAWAFARDCAGDYLQAQGVKEILYDGKSSLLLDGVRRLISLAGTDNFVQPERCLKKRASIQEYPAFAELRERLENEHRYLRLDDANDSDNAGALIDRPVLIGLDVGSTVAKIEVADAKTDERLFLGAYSNAGDTIETIKRIFRDLQGRGVETLHIVRIGITGSARYQVQESLHQIFPQLEHRISVLVENYAHARGSIDLAREHIRHLKALGIEDINEELFILVDIGGEDTKLSTVALQRGELFDNVMNVKCSAGTGSLMDSLRSLFNIETIEEATRLAFQAKRAYSIKATCAVFLIENARKLQAQNYPLDEILASANWAIVENMARTLWSQLALPENAVVLLHGQTMLSDPLPLAVSQRLQEFIGAPAWCLVPPHPGHRACRGLIRNMAQTDKHTSSVSCQLEDFVARHFEKRIIHCHGAACGDKQTRCNRTSLKSIDVQGKRFSFSLGGCSAINELLARKAALKRKGKHKGKSKGEERPVTDTYKMIWEFIDTRLPRSDMDNRLVIPRSFAVSEWALFFCRLFQHFDIPVHVDNVCESDLLEAQPFFHIDTCAPQMGAVGQLQRLARQPHGMILAPQIEYLPTQEQSLGRTCTVNQGGLMTAANLAGSAFSQARFHVFNVALKTLEAQPIAQLLHTQLKPVFRHYGIEPSMDALCIAVSRAIEEHYALRRQTADYTLELMETAHAQGRPIAVVMAREYILNPGIYDSHVGRLLRDKNIAAVPSHVLDVELDPAFSHIYWRTPHMIVTMLSAIAERRLHNQLTHPGLKKLFRQLEMESDNLLAAVQVSTFHCGPDSMIAPVAAEIMKNRPFLLIQSDAVIKELAHLENRVNTYVKQLELGLHGELAAKDGEPFKVDVLKDISDIGSMDKGKDVIYFPTFSDNRTVTSVMRAAGFTCIDNYDDETYDLEAIVRKGRRIAGDSVCVPMAASYGDVLLAMEDFSRRKEQGDPVVAGKSRLLIFNHKGTGPCRQGQYSDLQSLFLWQKLGNYNPKVQGSACLPGDILVQLMIGEEEKGFNPGIDEWVLARMFQGTILQGIFHTLLFKGGANCRDLDEYRAFQKDYRQMKQAVYRCLESQTKPGHVSLWLGRHASASSQVGIALKYIAYGLHRRDLRRLVNGFARKWVQPSHIESSNRLKIFIEGEAYMRTTQAETIFELLLATLGFRRFSLNYTPLWTYLDYLLASEEIELAAKEQANGADETKHNFDGLRRLLREVLAAPLYRAAGISLPEAMPEVLDNAKPLMPTLRPIGELAPYVGEVRMKLQEGYDLVLNAAPESCMVASMGEVLTPGILDSVDHTKGRIQNIFSADGEIDEDSLTIALLKTMGPENYYQCPRSKSEKSNAERIGS